MVPITGWGIDPRSSLGLGHGFRGLVICFNGTRSIGLGELYMNMKSMDTLGNCRAQFRLPLRAARGCFKISRPRIEAGPKIWFVWMPTKTKSVSGLGLGLIQLHANTRQLPS